MAKRPQFAAYVSPIAKAKMAFLDKPSKPYKDGDKETFKVRGLIEDTAENRAWVQKIIDKALEEAKANGIKMKKVFHIPFIMPEDVDEDDFIPEAGKDRAKYDEDHRGKIFFDAKSIYKPGLIDTARESLPESVKIYGGDDIRVKFEAEPYLNGTNCGITLRLKTVQLVAKNTSFTGGRGPDTDGFDDIDGYRAPADEDGDEDEDF